MVQPELSTYASRRRACASIICTGSKVANHQVTKTQSGCILIGFFFSAYLCVPLRLCGKCARTTCLPQRRRGTQRYAEKIRHHPRFCDLSWWFSSQVQKYSHRSARCGVFLSL